MGKILLKQLELENFKCYKKSTIKFRELSIIVGENNAGKSCLIESLRLISRAAQQIKTRKTFEQAPLEFGLPVNIKGFKINTQKLKIDLSMAVYFYENTYAKISALFNDKSKIEIYINEEYAFVVVYNEQGDVVKSFAQAQKLNINKIGILPQIGPLRDNEGFISQETVVADKDTYLSSLHFRNEMLLWKDLYFDVFKEYAEKSWDGLEIKSLDYDRFVDTYIGLFVVDNRFTAEIGKMGSGLQMWLQIMWFLARSKDCNLIILDEPDVYMHPDMQRKLLELVKTKYPQVIIATHSIEIISRVQPECILEINKKDKAMKYATDYVAVQRIIDDIGGVQNLSLLKLGRSRKCLFVEGKDLEFLNRFNECLHGRQLDIPTISFGGFNNIPRVYGTANLFFQETEGAIKCYALADKDYRDSKIVDKIKNDASQEHLELHIWERKEIENYLIIPEVLYQFVPKNKGLVYEDFLAVLDTLLDSLREDVFDSYSNQLERDSKTLSGGQQWNSRTCNPLAREFMNANWTSLENKIKLVGGKDFLAKVRQYFQDNYKVTLTNNKIFSKLTENLIPEEVRDFLSILQ